MLKVLKVLKVLRVLKVLVLMVLAAACGSPTRPSNGSRQTQGQHTSEMRLTDWVLNVDGIGRLSGSIAYTYESRFTTGLQSFTTVTRADLRNVVLTACR